jgi:hypothetical protein
MMYASVQSNDGTMNVVLFHKSARVELLELPEGTELSVSTNSDSDDNGEGDWWVWEEVPRPTHPVALSDEDNHSPSSLPPHRSPVADLAAPEGYDLRTPVLRLDSTSVELRIVRSVVVRTSAHMVRRHRSEKRDSPLF